MVLCKNCKRCIEYTNENGTLYLCHLDYYTCDDIDDLPCDFYVPLDVNDSESKRDQA